ncbi:MAG: LPS export ABC transporter permease LptG [Magnetococcales bacterium]|nr:LPS export ABC transporter permease LptG [Magnetococcales bacterium]
MPVLYRYLMNLYLTGFFKITGIFVGLFIVLDGADQIRRSAKLPNANWQDLILLILLRMPEYLFRFIPAIALMSTLLVLSRLVQNNEITVMRTSGVSIYRILIPFLLGGFFIALGQLFIHDQIIPRTNHAAQLLYDHMDNKLTINSKAGQDMWIRDRNDIVHASASVYNKAMLDVTIFSFNDHHELVRRIDARKGELDAGQWMLIDGIEYRFGDTIDSTTFMRRPWEVQLEVEQLNRATPQPNFLSIRQLWNYAERLNREGYDASAYLVVLQRKLSDSVITMSAILLAFPFSIRLSRMGGMTRSVLTGILVGFFLFVLVDLTTALGLGGRLPPVLAAWAPVVFFGGIGGFLLIRLEEIRS